jgi:esterase/lipase superfamily enzyme
MWKGAVDQMIDMALATGRQVDAARYSALSSGLARAFRQAFVNIDGSLGNGSQIGYILALEFGLLDASIAPRSGQKLSQRYSSPWQSSKVDCFKRMIHLPIKKAQGLVRMSKLRRGGMMTNIKGLTCQYALLLLLALALPGCATQVKGMMRPVEPPVKGGQTVNMIVATDRQSSDKPEMLFTGERGEQITLSEVVISIPPAANRKRGEVQWPRRRKADPDREFATVSATPITAAQIDDWLSRIPAENRGHVIIFVHGYNTPFDRGVYLFAQVFNDAGIRAAPVLFSWPSRGQTLAYGYDRESAMASRTDFARVLEEAVAQTQVTDITILAHSMGTDLTMESLRTLALTHGAVPSKIRNVILASPDIDVNVFRKQFEDLGSQPPSITLFVSKDDKALRLSRLLGGNVDRLGAADFSREPYRSAIDRTGIRVVDLSDVHGVDDSDHLKFSENPEIVSVIGNALIGGQSLDDNQTSLYDKMGVLVIGGSRLGFETAKTITNAKP